MLGVSLSGLAAVAAEASRLYTVNEWFRVTLQADTLELICLQKALQDKEAGADSVHLSVLH